ncbi:hypothetical protein [Shewanella sp.]|uniref:hypothetical protein n=1 Tax=Shewanella sp. TaxID=50422 RepID=UPI003A980F04
MSTTTSLTPAQAIANEVNLVIATINSPTPCAKEMAEAALESLQAVAESLAPTVARDIKVRLVALRNNIHVQQVRAA